MVISNNEELNSYLQTADKLLILKFYADWCNPCRILSTHLNEVLANYPDTVELASIDVDKFKDLPKELEIRGIPVLVFYKNGEILGKHVGLLNRYELKNLLEKFLAN